MTEKCALIFNPSAGGGKALRRQKSVQARLEDRNIPYDLYVTDSEAHLVETAKMAAQRYPLVIGAGGDTTISIIATQILRGGKKNTLGIIGLGSVNDLAREIGVHKLEKAVDAIKNGITAEFDVGVARSQNHPHPHYFLVAASLGLGVAVNRYVDTWMRKHPLLATFRSTTQGIPAISAIRRAFHDNYVPLELTLECSGKRHAIVTSLLIFSNISTFGGLFRVSPTAGPVSRKLDCCTFDFTSLAGALRVSLDIKRQKQLEKNSVQIFRDDTFKLYSENPLEFQLDGEIIELGREVEISVQPRAIRMITINPFPGETSPGEKQVTS